MSEHTRDSEVQDFRMDELYAVMISVDKWLPDDYPTNINPATRAADAREIALKAIEKLRGQRDRAVEALRLMYKLHMKACDDAGGCPYDCRPGESCEDCTPSMAEKSARAAIAEIEGGE